MIIDQLSHSYGNHKVLEQVRFTLPARGVVALRGPNGSGKTTLLKLLGGVLPSSCASLKALRKNHRFVYLDHDFLTLDWLKVSEFMSLLGLEIPGFRNSQEITSQLVDLTMQSLPLQALSLGQRQRCVLAVAFGLPNVDVLLLDEPFNGLDAEATALGRRGLSAFGERGCALVATHDSEFANDSLIIRGANSIEEVFE